MSEDVRQQLVALLPRLRRFALSLTGSRGEADDLVQAACERALSRLHQWQPGTRLDHWVLRILKTLWIDQWRGRRRHGDQVDLDSVELPAPRDDQAIAEARDTLGRVCQAMARLPDEHRLALTLVAVDGLS